MTDTSTMTAIEARLAEGHRALEAGNTVEARKHFRWVSENDPDNIAALVGIARSVRPYRDKQELLERVLTLDPAHQEARDLLTAVQEQLAAGKLLSPKTEPVAPPPAPEPLPDTSDETDEDDLLSAFMDDEEVGPHSATNTDVQMCYRHPERETGLRCVQCERPICTECVRPAFVGQLCPDCAQARRPRNYQVTASHILTAAIVAVLAGGLTSVLIVALGLGFLGIILAFLVAPFFAEMLIRLLDYLTHAKRGREMQLAVGLGLAFGFAPLLLLLLLVGGFVLPLLVFGGIAIATTVTRLR